MYAHDMLHFSCPNRCDFEIPRIGRQASQLLPTSGHMRRILLRLPPVWSWWIIHCILLKWKWMNPEVAGKSTASRCQMKFVHAGPRTWAKYWVWDVAYTRWFWVMVSISVNDFALWLCLLHRIRFVDRNGKKRLLGLISNSNRIWGWRSRT